MAKISISVIVPMFNRLKYIDECLDSALKQDVDVELIVVDDCSSDGGYEHVLEKYGSLPNVTILRNEENQGVSFSRNRGILAAKGEYIQFIDSDDYIVENSLGRLYKLAVINELDVLHAIGCYKLKDNKRIFVLEYDGERPGEISIRNKAQLMTDFANYNMNISSCEKIIRREFLINNEIQFADVNLQEDSLFNLDLIIKAKRYGLTSNIHNVIRMTADSLSRKKDPASMIKNVTAAIIGNQRVLTEMFSESCWQGYEKYQYKVSEVLFQGLLYLLEIDKSWEQGFDYVMENAHEPLENGAKKDEAKLLGFMLFYMPFLKYFCRSRATQVDIMKENVQSARAVGIFLQNINR